MGVTLLILAFVGFCSWAIARLGKRPQSYVRATSSPWVILIAFSGANAAMIAERETAHGGP